MAQQTGRESDKFMLRLPDGMRDRIKAAAEKNGRSMNAEIVNALESVFSKDSFELEETVFEMVDGGLALVDPPYSLEHALRETSALVRGLSGLEQRLKELSEKAARAVGDGVDKPRDSEPTKPSRDDD